MTTAVAKGNPVSTANGIVYTVDLKGFLDAYDARVGAPLLHRPIALQSGTGTDLVASWGELKADKTPLTEIAAHRKEASALVDELRFDEGPQN